MKLERQSAMVKSVAKNMRIKERNENKKEKARDELCKVLRKAGKPLDEITRNDITKKEYDIIVRYFKVVRGYASEYTMVQVYPNLK